MANRERTQELLELACAMWDDPLVFCYQDLGFATEEIPSVFLAGPSSRHDVLEFKWRIFEVRYLREAGFQGAIYIPEPRNDDWSFKDKFPLAIVEWESQRILRASIVSVWLAREQVQLPGRVTNTEIGFLGGMAYADPERFKKRLIWGHPPNAWKVKAERHWIGNVADIEPFSDLKLMCEHITALLQN